MFQRVGAPLAVTVQSQMSWSEAGRLPVMQKPSVTGVAAASVSFGSDSPAHCCARAGNAANAGAKEVNTPARTNNVSSRCPNDRRL